MEQVLVAGYTEELWRCGNYGGLHETGGERDSTGRECQDRLGERVVKSDLHAMGRNSTGLRAIGVSSRAAGRDSNHVKATKVGEARQ